MHTKQFPPSMPIPATFTDLSSTDATCGFYADVLEGLNSDPKYLESKYFYDATGDKLFQQIMELDEYYPFACELEIFRAHAAEIADKIMATANSFDLIELGAGDCTKTIHLLKQLTAAKADFTYMPVDISKNIIDDLQMQLPKVIEGISVTGLNGSYFEMLDKASRMSQRRKVILFLGSNLGNMRCTEAMEFCMRMRSLLNPGDLVILGLDLKKDPATILAAYNDKSGVTKAFNLNLLTRINRELHADFDPAQFEHYANYDPETGSCRSYLISKKAQFVDLNGELIHFAKDEFMEMEISQKYTLNDINDLAEIGSFKTEAWYFDSRKWFVDVIWKTL